MKGHVTAIVRRVFSGGLGVLKVVLKYGSLRSDYKQDHRFLVPVQPPRARNTHLICDSGGWEPWGSLPLPLVL